MLDHANAQRVPRLPHGQLDWLPSIGTVTPLIAFCFRFSSTAVNRLRALVVHPLAAILCSFGASLALLRANSWRRAVS